MKIDNAGNPVKIKASTSSAICRFLVLLSLLAAHSADLTAQRPVGPGRPSSVPADYLVTPFGYFHPSCVKRLAKGDVLLRDSRSVKHADGNFDSLPTCNYPRYLRNGEVWPGNSGNGPTINHAYVEDATVTTNTSYGELLSNWVVPPAPSSNDGQTLYFFPGLEDLNPTKTILQPVLGWNGDFSGAWGIASWNCCVSGITSESVPYRVSSGDTIYGMMKATCGAGTLSCGSWNVTTQDLSSGSTTTLSQTSADGQTFNWAFGGAVEVYDVAQCSDYPTNGSISFMGLSLYDYNYNQISNPSWSIYENTSITPQCYYGGQKTGTQVSLSYGQAPPPPVCQATPSCTGSGNYAAASVNLSCTTPTQISTSAELCGLYGSGNCTTNYGQSGNLTYSSASTSGTVYSGATCSLNWCIGGTCTQKSMVP